MSAAKEIDDLPAKDKWFATTHWSVVLAAGEDAGTAARLALDQLCRSYWFPLYAYVRRQGRSPEEAQDLTQEFFLRFIEKRYLGLADPARGRFRTFLLTAMKRFLVNDWIRDSRLKRGGGRQSVSWDAVEAEQRYGAEPADALTPELIYEKQWAATLLERALDSLSGEYARNGQRELFDHIKRCLWGEEPAPAYADIALRLGMTEGAVKVAAHRLRQRFRVTLRNEVAQTVGQLEAVDEELRHLVSVMGK